MTLVVEGSKIGQGGLYAAIVGKQSGSISKNARNETPCGHGSRLEL